MISFSRGRGGIAAKILLLILFLLLTLGGVTTAVYRSGELRERIFEWRLETLPGADYVPLISALCDEERYDEAALLAAFAARYPDMPGQEAIAAARERIDDAIRRKRSPLERGASILGGILSGGQMPSVGGLIADIAAGFAGTGVMPPEGDVPPRAREDAEKLADALKGARLGFVTERWFPGAMRTLRRSGLIGPEYERFLLENARESAERDEATPELQSAVAGTQTLVTELGLPLAFAMHRSVRSDEDLTQLAMWSRLSPDETYIVASQGGIELLSLLPDTAEGRGVLAEIAKKGERGIRSARFWLARPK